MKSSIENNSNFNKNSRSHGEFYAQSTTPPAPTSTLQANLIHLYEINNSLADGYGGPSLVGLGGSLSSNGYIFPRNGGLELSGSLLNDGIYTIIVDVTFDTLSPRAWQKIIDFKNRSSDAGLYVYALGGQRGLQFFPNSGIVGTVKIGTRHRFVISRSSSGQVKTYVDNSEQFIFDDSVSQMAVATNNKLLFCVDDLVVPNENDSGIIHRIEIYDGPLLSSELPPLPFDSCSSNCNNNIILNGEFNSSSPAGDNGSATYWTTNNADVTNLYIASGGISSDLNVWVDLNSYAKGYIEQSFSTIFGKEYTVYFKLAGNNVCTPAQPCAGSRQHNTTNIKECRVSAAGLSQDYSFDITGTDSSSWQGMGWSNEQFTFTAISNSTTLRFESLSPDGFFGPAIDCVEVCPTCNNTNIDVSIPGTILRSGNYTNICFRVGGPDCCNSGASNAWSNEVCIAIPPPPPEPPQPTAPAICDLDISGYSIHCNYDSNACGGGHSCNRAIFDIYVNDMFVFVSNLNNGGTGADVFTNSTIPSNISAQDYRGNGLEYKIEARPNSANSSVHRGICQIIIYDLTGLVVFNACVPNSQVVYVAAGQNCPTPTPTPTPTLQIFTNNCANDLLLDGDFENLPITLEANGQFGAWNMNNVDIWSLSTHYPDTTDPNGNNKILDLNACSAGWIEQTINTSAGVSYILYFNLGVNPVGDIGNLRSMRASVIDSDSATIAQESFSVSSVGATSLYDNLNWTTKNLIFTAVSSQTKIKFESTMPPTCFGPYIDLVKVCEIFAPTPTLTSTPTPTPTIGHTLTPTPTSTITRTLTQTPTVTHSQSPNYCLYAWGGNNSGQFGNGTTLSSIQIPSGVITSFDILELESGSLHSIAISTSKNLYLWGSNTYGQIGDGTTTQKTSPTQISINSQNSAENEWSKINASQFHSFAINSLGQLYGWGRNNNWQLGDGTNVDKNIPTRIGSDQTWTSINTGPWHTLAINDLGEIYAWGNNFNGSLGDGTNTNRSTPTKVGSSTNWTKVRAGSFSSFAINSLGELYAWGYNVDGTLGDGTNTNRNVPTRIGNETNWVDLSVFNFAVLAINSLGELYAWGYNQDGQVGDGTNTNRNSPVRIGSATNWSSISSGGVHSLALNSLGELYSWGNNQSGQLGDGTSVNKNVPTRVGSSLNWQKIVGGGNYSLGLICSINAPTPTPTTTLTPTENQVSNDCINSFPNNINSSVYASQVSFEFPGQTPNELIFSADTGGSGNVEQIQVTKRSGSPDYVEINFIRIGPSAPHTTEIPVGTIFYIDTSNIIPSQPSIPWAYKVDQWILVSVDNDGDAYIRINASCGSINPTPTPTPTLTPTPTSEATIIPAP